MANENIVVEPQPMRLNVSGLKKHLSDGGRVFINGAVKDFVVKSEQIPKSEAKGYTKLLDYIQSKPQKITSRQWEFIFASLLKNGVYRTRHTLTLTKPKSSKSSGFDIIVE